MSGEEKHSSEGETPDDVLAGEYALGLLDAAGRAAVERRASEEPEFAARVVFWQGEFSAFNEAYDPVAPPDRVFQAIETRLHGATAPTSWWSSLAFWRPLALGVSSAFVLFVAVTLSEFAPAPGPQMVAALKSDENGLNSVVLYDPSTATLKMTVFTTPAGTDSDAELWLVRETGAPVSLGLLPKSGRLELPVAKGLQALVRPGTTFAISLEPVGGSPTGAATGPVVATGLLAEI